MSGPGGGMPPVNWDEVPTLGWQVIDWIEEFTVHGPGDVQGMPWEGDLAIDDEFATWLLWTYRVWPQGHPLAGRRMCRRSVLSLPKGRAKSEIAGAVMCAEALGPVRCDGFDANGEPVGRPVTYPFIRCMATEEEQAGNTYDNIVFMLTEGRAADEYAFDIGRSAETSTRVIIRELTGGEIRQSTSGDASKDGGKESASCNDEIHLYTSRKLRGMYRTVARNTGKRGEAEPLMVDTTTMFGLGENSIAEQAWERYAKLDAEECLEKHGVVFFHRQGPEPKRFNDDRSLTKALREAYGPAAAWMDFRQICQIIREAEEPEEEAYRYYLNRPRASSSTWLAPEQIEGFLAEETLAGGEKVTLGFDGSLNDDHTVLWAGSEQGLLQPVGIWAPGEEDGLEWRREVSEAVAWAFERFEVIRFYGDPPFWHTEFGEWSREFSDPARKGTLPVAEFYTNQDRQMAAATGALKTALLKGDARINPAPLLTEPLSFDGLPAAVWHFRNARRKKVRLKVEDGHEEAWVLRKDRPKSRLKIDSTIGAILAHQALLDARKLKEFDDPEYARAAWGDKKGGKKPKTVSKKDYLPCKGCAKPIHPKLHRGPEKGLCLKCRRKKAR